MKETHSYKHSAAVRKLEWNPNPEVLQVVSSDYNREILVFDYILNKVVERVDGGHSFCFDEKGKRIISIYDQELRVYALKGLINIGGIQT